MSLATLMASCAAGVSQSACADDEPNLRLLVGLGIIVVLAIVLAVLVNRQAG